mgnify:CR=1 FL=1
MNLRVSEFIGGRTNHSPLTPLGEQQAAALGAHLRAELAHAGVPPSRVRVYSSTAVRAVDTAQAVIKALQVGLTGIRCSRLCVPGCSRAARWAARTAGAAGRVREPDRTAGVQQGVLVLRHMHEAIGGPPACLPPCHAVLLAINLSTLAPCHPADGHLLPSTHLHSTLPQLDPSCLTTSEQLLELDQGEWQGLRRHECYTPELTAAFTADPWVGGCAGAAAARARGCRGGCCVAR